MKYFFCVKNIKNTKQKQLKNLNKGLPMRNIFCILALILLLCVPLAHPQKIAKTMFNMDGPVQDIVWCGQEELSGLWDSSNDTQPIYLKKIVFVVSGKGTVYRSIDEGKNFENMRARFEQQSQNLAKFVHLQDHNVKKRRFLIFLKGELLKDWNHKENTYFRFRCQVHDLPWDLWCELHD